MLFDPKDIVYNPLFSGSLRSMFFLQTNIPSGGMVIANLLVFLVIENARNFFRRSILK
jgi:hypothetical protein